MRLQIEVNHTHTWYGGEGSGGRINAERNKKFNKKNNFIKNTRKGSTIPYTIQIKDITYKPSFFFSFLIDKIEYIIQ